MAVQRFVVIPFPKDRYRVRLPGDFAGTLGWPKSNDSASCLGVFRQHGELLCTALELESAERIEALRSIAGSRPFPQTPIDISEVPTAEELILPFRIIEFRAVWLKAPSTQLELQLSATNTERLGWTIGSGAPIYAISWSRFLLLTSESRYAETHKEPIAL
jgi:hypothetical protein